MKTAFYIEGNPKNPGGYDQIINTTKFLKKKNIIMESLII